MQDATASVIESHGVRIGIAYPPELEGAVAPLLPPGARRLPPQRGIALLALEATGRAGHRVSLDGRELIATDRPTVALGVFEAALRAHVAEHAPGLTFIHAAAVAVAGVGIVLPGRSFAGKTTLAAALLAAGATYYSDEYAVLDGDGLVHPYPRPLSLRPRGRGSEVEVEPAALGARVGRRPLRPGMVVLTAYRPDATWAPAEVSAGAGALGLLGHAIPVRARPDETLDAVRAAARGCLVLEGERGEAAPVAADLVRRASRLTQHGP